MMHKGLQNVGVFSQQYFSISLFNIYYGQNHFFLQKKNFIILNITKNLFTKVIFYRFSNETEGKVDELLIHRNKKQERFATAEERELQFEVALKNV
jgi:hypothetical protein